jgi:protein-disulfide isomerase
VNVTARQWLAGAVGLLVGGAAVALSGGTGAVAADGDRASIEAVVRDYILNHPEIIPEAMTKLQERETAKLLAANRTRLETPFAGAWAGARAPDATLVMFTDYSCGFCRASVPDVERLLSEDKKLRIVWRELPILGPGSDAAARAGLSAAKLGRYMAFHRGMFAAGAPDAAKVAKVSKAAGVTILGGADIEREITTNIEMARTLGLTGTPSFVIGDKLLNGAVGYEALRKAVEEVRAKRG